MPARSVWSDAEDEILRSTEGVNADVVNERLVSAGFERRSPASIKNRRHYLKQQEQGRGGSWFGDRRGLPTTKNGEVDETTELVVRRLDLLAEIEALEARLADRRHALEETNRRIHGLLTAELTGDA